MIELVCPGVSFCIFRSYPLYLNWCIVVSYKVPIRGPHQTLGSYHSHDLVRNGLSPSPKDPWLLIKRRWPSFPPMSVGPCLHKSLDERKGQVTVGSKTLGVEDKRVWCHCCCCFFFDSKWKINLHHGESFYIQLDSGLDGGSRNVQRPGSSRTFRELFSPLLVPRPGSRYWRTEVVISRKTTLTQDVEWATR